MANPTKKTKLLYIEKTKLPRYQFSEAWVTGPERAIDPEFYSRPGSATFTVSDTPVSGLSRDQRNALRYPLARGQ